MKPQREKPRYGALELEQKMNSFIPELFTMRSRQVGKE